MLYRWPQGRILRIIMVIAVILVTVDLGMAGWGQYEAWQSGTDGEIESSSLVYASILGSLAAIAFIAGLIMVLFAPKSAQFLIEVEQEMTKVNWPSRVDLIRSTILITVMAVVLAALIALIDIVNFFIVHTTIIGGG
ncbi:MAG: preprotein translocase subunit SecE [Planctomycetota bacterium]|nr:MAG: preprotein translocase subunit SecE [Planctomycetota bacterium]